jgi:hypothetical protein
MGIMGQNREDLEAFEANIEGFWGIFSLICTVF